MPKNFGITFPPTPTAPPFCDVYFRLDPQNRIVDYYAAREADLGAAPQQLIGRTFGEVLPPDAAQVLQDGVEQVRSNGQPLTVVYGLKEVDRQFEARILPACDRHHVVVARDISAANRAVLTYEQLTALLETTTNLVAACDCDRRVLYINSSGRRMLGIVEDDNVLGMPEAEVYAASVQELMRTIAIPTAERQGTWSGESVIRHRDGREIPVSQIIMAHRKSDGSLDFLSTVMRDISEHKAFEQALQDAEKRYRSIFENAVEGIFQSSLDGRYLICNPKLAEIYGYDSPRKLMSSITNIEHQVYVDPQRRADFKRILEQHGRVEGFEAEFRRKDGSVIWISENARAIYKQTGEEIDGAKVLVGYEGTVVDITARVRAEAERTEAEAALRQNETRLREIVEHSSNLFYKHTCDHVLTYISPQTRTFFDCEPEEALHLWTEFATDNPVNQEGFLICQKAIDSGLPQPLYQLELKGKKGRVIWVEVNEAPVVRDGKTVAIVGALVDVTQRKAIEGQLKHQAFHDSLTNLPNRALFMDRLQHAIESLLRRQGYLAVLFLDLDRFKIVNDSLGHEMGDHLLQEVAERLRASLRPGDTVARLGGDEFTILMEEISDVSDAVHIAERIAEELQKPLSLQGQEVFVTTSIGIAISHSRAVGQGADSAEDLLRDADVAMYRAKNNGRAHYEVFDPEMNARALERLTLETDLWQAIGRDELRVYYQPVITLGDSALAGFEALVRWQHPQQGLIAPLDFIPLAEETGIILPIGQWVLREACLQAQRWCQSHPRHSAFEMSVNLSARQLQHAGLADEISSVLQETGLEPWRLKLEITESVVMGEAEISIRTLRELKALGVQLAIDDFGTGYSSLAYLRRFPVDCLKIDRTFIAKVGIEEEDTQIVRAIISLAQTLGLTVTAEGIETREQAAQLHDLNCDSGQGYLFARPLPADAVLALLDSFSPTTVERL